MRTIREPTQATITVIYDDHPFDPGFSLGSGFACLLQMQSRVILFDTGGHGPTLLRNLHAARVSPSSIDTIVMSHFDADHAGGLPDLLRETPVLRVYVPESTPPALTRRLRAQGNVVIEVSKRTEVAPSVYAFRHSGNQMEEQSLAINTHNGLTLLIADAHPGILEMMKRVKRSLHADIALVLGGFHMEGSDQRLLRSKVAAFKRLGVARVAPCHSIGEPAMKVFRSSYGSDCLNAGVGTKVDLRFLPRSVALRQQLE